MSYQERRLQLPPLNMQAFGISLAAPFQQFNPRNRNRRQLSIGGPPKAVLGGPAKKLSPLPAAALAAAAGPNPARLSKKVAIKIPQESGSRNVLERPFQYHDPQVPPPEIATAEEYPSTAWRKTLPRNIDVFLPAKDTWDVLKQQEIEEKLERLGVERGSGSSSIHARAASISSPADPALLLFKLNKLQQSQASPFAVGSASTASSLTNSVTSTPSSAMFAPRHVHSLSLAPYPSSASPNPFGFSATLGGDYNLSLPPSATMRRSPLRSPLSVITTTANENTQQTPLQTPLLTTPLHAPQGRVPVSVPNLTASGAALSAVARPDSKPDFLRGFGIAEESEEELAADAEEYVSSQRESDSEDEDKENSATVQHTRHQSRLSAALSMRSFGGLVADGLKERLEELTSPNTEERPNDADVDEWTASETESIGEWSNPSDEEHARQMRLQKRRQRTLDEQNVVHITTTDSSLETETPRRIPNFPRPPDNTTVFSRPIPPDDESDIISNPSEEEHYRRLPPLPHSRGDSGTSLRVRHHHMVSAPHSAHDPSHAHSRGPSDSLSPTIDHSQHHHHPSASASLQPGLNPFARPFVFGAPAPGSGPTSAPLLGGHARLQSIGKPLNAGAKEFTPAGFSFRAPVPGTAPPGPMPVPTPSFPIPQPAFPVPNTSLAQPLPPLPTHVGASGSAGQRPLPLPPPSAPVFSYANGEQESPFAVQGREKRQRQSSYDSESVVSDAGTAEGHGGKDSMASFKFPTPQKPQRTTVGNVVKQAEPFSFPPKPRDDSFVEEGDTLFAHAANSTRLDIEDEDDERSFERDLAATLETPSKPRRAPPNPLDFKQHPVSGNTVPAGVFKALASATADERTRRGARSRLSSHSPFDPVYPTGGAYSRPHSNIHSARPSLDDSNVAGISSARKGGAAGSGNRMRMVTDPGVRQLDTDDDDLFTGGFRRELGHERRRSSLPENLTGTREAKTPSDMSEDSPIRYPARKLVARIEMQHVESALERILEEKLAPLIGSLSASLSPHTEQKINEVVQMFRSQMQDSAARGLDDSQLDARGEIDFELIKDIVLEGHQESLAILKQELADLAPKIVSNAHTHTRSPHVTPQQDTYVLEAQNSRIMDILSDLSARVSSMQVPQADHDLLLNDLMSALRPTLNSLHRETVDYDLITQRLTQAVKPHISQLIDLASDKRETAALIVEKLSPLLPPLTSPVPPIDTDAITLRLTTEVRRAIAPIDAFEIKEQVADLVVERLDSRLALRDKTFNVDTVAAKVAESIVELIKPLEALGSLPSNLATLSQDQKTVSSQQLELISAQSRMTDLVSGLPQTLRNALKDLKLAASATVGAAPSGLSDESMLQLKSTLTEILTAQQNLAQRGDELSSVQQETLQKLLMLPESISTATNAIQAAHAEFSIGRDAYKRELDELRKLHTEAQVGLAKARGAHGQVRVEKDMLQEKLSVVEADRDRLREQVKALGDAGATRAGDIAAAEAKITQLQDSHAQALARLQSADVGAQTAQERIAELEKVNRDLMSEKQVLKSRADSLDLQIKFSQRDRETAEKALSSLQKQYDALSSQQSQWDELQRASEKIDMLANLVSQRDEEELLELRRVRDRHFALEAEHAALQKKFKETESKFVTSEKSMSTIKQTLTQAQQRGSEWEKRAREAEGKLEHTQTMLEQSEQTQNQLDADYVMVKMQLEERQANERAKKDWEMKQQSQISALEAKVLHLQTELSHARDTIRSAKTPTTAVPYRNGTNVPRPDSRASTVNGGATTPPPRATLWDSMHNPNNPRNRTSSAVAAVKAPPPRPAQYSPTPRSRPPTVNRMYSRSSMAAPPSPTPSTVSLAPTIDADGWWS